MCDRQKEPSNTFGCCMLQISMSLILLLPPFVLLPALPTAVLLDEAAL
jgi:hypothetical protein